MIFKSISSDMKQMNLLVFYFLFYIWKVTCLQFQQSDIKNWIILDGLWLDNIFCV